MTRTQGIAWAAIASLFTTLAACDRSKPPPEPPPEPSLLERPPAALPKAVHGHRAHLVQGRIFAFGGFGETAVAWNGPIAGWTDVAPMPTHKAFFSSAVVDERIYTVGAQAGQSAIERYDPTEDRWHTVLRSARLPKSHLATAALGHQLYILGGFPDAAGRLQVFDTRTGQLSDAPPLPGFHAGDHFHYLAPLAGQLHVIGGMRFQPDSDVLDQHWALEGDAWRKRAPLPNPAMSKFGVHGVASGRFYLFSKLHQLHHVYDPATDRWSGKLAPLERVIGMAATVADGQRLYVLGGMRPDALATDTGSSWFDIGSNRWHHGVAR